MHGVKPHYRGFGGVQPILSRVWGGSNPFVDGLGGFKPHELRVWRVQTPSVEGFGGFKPGVQKVFEEVPIRTELANMPLVVSVEGAPEKEGNYNVVKGKRKHAVRKGTPR
jgi:hypothetical protein